MSIKDIAAKGRYGDNHLLHVSDAEVQGLNALANKMYGHGLTTNPETGLPEAFLFAPLLAGALAPAGMGALGVGLTAGALGAAEAAARGMDDPLMQGAMAGLTAGAGSAISSNLSQMGAEGAIQGGTQIGNQAVQAPIADASMSGLTGTGVDLTPDVAEFGKLSSIDAMGSQPRFAPATFSAPSSSTLPTANQFGMTGGIDTIGTGQGAVDLSGGVNVASPSTNIATDTMSRSVTQPTTFGESAQQYGSDLAQKYKDIGAGAKKAFGSQEGFKQFMGDNQMALAAGVTGLGGSAALDAQQSAREAMEEQEGRKKAKYDEMVARIKQNYADVGRPLPTNPYGPLFSGPQGFKEGRSVYSEAVPKPNFDEELDKLSLDELRRLKGMITQYKSDLDGPPSGNEWVSNDATLDALIRAEELTGRSMADDAVKFKEGKEVKPITMPEPGSYLPDWVKKYAQDQQKKTDKRAGGGYLEGGIASLKGDGMSDSVPAKIDGSQPAALSTGEYVIPADVVSHLGNGSSDDGAMRLDEMLDRVRMARTDTKKQAPQIKPDKYLPA